MMLPKKIKHPLVWIQWLDATTHNAWVEVSDLKKEVGLFPTTTVGFLVKEDEEAYYIASTVHDDMTNAQITLPRGMVQSIVFGKFTEKRKKKLGAQPIQDAVCNKHIQE